MPVNNFALIRGFFGVILVAALFSCRDKNREMVTTTVAGCMDPSATNYNAKATTATTCHYPNEQLAGAYCVTDTCITFYHDMTTGWYDTTRSSFTINVTAVTKDSLAFDKVLICNHTYPGSGFIYSNNCTTFSFAEDYPPYLFSGSGYFKGDTLYYQDGIRPIPTSSGSLVNRWGRGVKYAN